VPAPAAPLLLPAQADELIRAHVPALPLESLPLAQAAGLALRQSVHAERDEPPFDRVAMDGIAFDSRSGARRFAVQGTQMAGDAPLTLASQAHCIEVMTGTVLPPGCDCVVPYEEVTINGGFAQIGSAARIEPRQHVHPRATDAQAGCLLLSPGVRLRGAELAIAAAAGLPRLTVASAPRIAVLSTGSELIEPGEPILPHQVRRSNAYALLAALREHGYVRVTDEHIPDDAGALAGRLRHHLDTHDALVLTGGVSMGKLDLVPGTLEQLGVQRVFHRVAQRPGRPLWFGVAPSGTMVFGLPGNPVSTAVSLTRYVLPALALAQGLTPRPAPVLALAADFTPSRQLTSFVPVQVEQDTQARAWAVLRPPHTSGDFVSLSGTDGFVEVPPGAAPLPRGTCVPLYRW
jgi:molybdopterin molybdotransferase